jgi:hypothetical protein
MSVGKYTYNTNLAKGNGFVNETLTLIEFYEEDDTKQTFLHRCVSQNILDKSTEYRTKDIINLVFYDRFWKSNNIIKSLKILRENGLSLEALTTLIFIYTARANKVFFDFVLVLNEFFQSKKISNENSKSFLLEAISDNKAPSWSDKMIQRVSSYLISCLKDFDLIDRDGFLKINFPDQKVINYLVHELHFNGKTDAEIVKDDVWKLLGLSEYDVLKEIDKISFRGTFIFQYSGEIIKIGWNYKNMEEFIENEYR